MSLAVRECGDPHGLPVVFHHGTPACGIAWEPWAEDAARRGLRLVGFDRPGYGDSPRDEGRDVAAVAAQVAELADRLGIERFATWGVSGGAPHALACAALLPDRVVAAASLCGPAPFDADGLDWFAGQGEGNVAEHAAAAEGEDALRPLLEHEAAAMRSGETSGLDTLLSPPDRAMLGRVGGYLGETFRLGTGGGLDGWLDDDLAFTRPWGFDPGAIRVPVLLLHGDQDAFVPVAHARWLAGRIPGVDARVSADDGHLSLYDRVPEVHAWLLSRL